MSKPTLLSANVYAVPQVLGGKGVTEFMQKKPHAVGPIEAGVAMLGFALAAV